VEGRKAYRSWLNPLNIFQLTELSSLILPESEDDSGNSSTNYSRMKKLMLLRSISLAASMMDNKNIDEKIDKGNSSIFNKKLFKQAHGTINPCYSI
jgi:hypothetical protein